MALFYACIQELRKIHGDDLSIHVIYEDQPVNDFKSLFLRLQGKVVNFKAGVHLKAVFWLGIMFLMQISRLRFKQSRISMLISHTYVLRRFVNFLVIFRFIWR